MWDINEVKFEFICFDVESCNKPVIAILVEASIYSQLENYKLSCLPQLCKP